MKINKYINKEIMFLLILTIAVGSYTFVYIRNHRGQETTDMIEETMIDDIIGADKSKMLQTVERNNEKISTQIGKKKLTVISYYNDENRENRLLATGLSNPVKETWISLKPKKEYKIGVLLPHFEDKFWITANYAIVNYAKELGVDVKVYEAGGYIGFGKQKEQLQALARDNEVDGIIFAALNRTKFNSDVANIVNSKKPVVELVNNINSPKISAKSMVSYYEMGYKAGEFVVQDAAGKDIKIAFFPGPEESGWAPDTLNGFKDAIIKLKKENQQINISTPYYGDTRPSVQRMHVISVLEKDNDYDYLVGCAPAAVEAEKYIAANKEEFKNTKIVSTYITSEVYDSIQRGSILASPSDQTIEQCRIALDMIVKILNGEKPGVDFPFQSGPEVPIISQDNISQFKYEDLFGSQNYIPVLNHMNE